MSHERGSDRKAALALLTVSDTRTFEDDRSGAAAAGLVEAAGHRVHDRCILPDEPDRICEWVRYRLADAACEGVIVCGGTGISARDRTGEAVAELFDKRLDGFGELFRMLSYEQIGPRAMLSRAAGGVAGGKPLFAIPGSPKAVELALELLILPVLGHLLDELEKH